MGSWHHKRPENGRILGFFSKKRQKNCVGTVKYLWWYMSVQKGSWGQWNSLVTDRLVHYQFWWLKYA